MRTRWSIASVVAVLAVAGAAVWYAQSQAAAPRAEPQGKKQAPKGSQVLMCDKLTCANKALEGLALEDFDKIAESAEKMRMISRAASWYVIDSEEYARYSKNFQEEATDLTRHAKQKNLDAASLDYMRLTMTCVQCHQHLRQVRGAKKP